MEDSASHELVVQLKRSCERLSCVIREPASLGKDSNDLLEALDTLNLLKRLVTVVRTGCGDVSPEQATDWSADFYRSISSLCFDRYVSL